jgi:hypothetical protein
MPETQSTNIEDDPVGPVSGKWNRTKFYPSEVKR